MLDKQLAATPAKLIYFFVRCLLLCGWALQWAGFVMELHASSCLEALLMVS